MRRHLLILLAILCSFFNQSFAQGEFWGTTYYGGANYLGTIYKTNADGTNPTIQYSFRTDFPGASPVYSHLTEAPNGKLYGLTSWGGGNGKGVLFEYDPASGTYLNKFDFDGPNGSHPVGSLVLHSNNKFYGTTQTGGANGKGVLFEFDPSSGSLVKKIDFDDNSNGAYPTGSLLKASNNKLYATTLNGGANGVGILFEYDPSTNTFTKKVDFNGIDGANPINNDLYESSNGRLFGMTYWGGSSNKGVLFVYDLATSTYTKKLDFEGASNGAYPMGALVESGGFLYGVTHSGGSNDFGTLFKYDPTNDVLSKKQDFVASDYSNPTSGMMKSSNGKLYGLIPFSNGIYSGPGILYEFDPSSDSFVKKLDFSFNGESGYYPEGDLMECSNGKMYGMTFYGGLSNNGVIFEYNPTTNVRTKKIDFNYAPNGASPMGNLTMHPNGKLYGLSPYFGIYGKGVIFEFDPAAKALTNRFNFDGTTSGGNPYGNLTLASNGKFYGSTVSGGSGNVGTLFEFDPLDNSFVKKFDFDWTSGAFPYGDLASTASGKLLGMTYTGGTTNEGVIFEYDPANNILTKKVDFNRATIGAYPTGTLTPSLNGRFYGTTSNGGANNSGTIFEFDPNSYAITKKYDLESSYSFGNANRLIAHPNGKIYGTTYRGGNYYCGALLEFDPSTNTLNKKVDFDYNSGDLGGDPKNLILSPVDNLLYGVTGMGGTLSAGALFKYDPSIGSIATVFDFDPSIGTNPQAGLTFVNTNGKAFQIISFGPLASKKIGDAPFDLVASASSGLPVTFTSSDPTIASINGTTVTILKAGSVIITAHQSGDANTNPALDVQQTLAINSDTGSGTGTGGSGSGSNPVGGLWGMTSSGGAYNIGAIFKSNGDGTNPSLEYSFKTDFPGSYPSFGSMIEATNGKLYGVTISGGQYNKGVLYEYDKNSNSYLAKFFFDGTNSGSYPTGSLFESSDGQLYGMTTQGGANNLGVLYKFDVNANSFSKIIDFDGNSTGSFPYGDLIKSSNGKLYGLSFNGGSNNQGIIFEFDPNTSLLSKKFDFDGVNGAYPPGGLFEATDGKLYGVTEFGGNNNNGVLFQFDPASNLYSKKIDFNGASNGRQPGGSLIQTSNGKIYGITSYGGTEDKGVLFTYDPNTQDIVKSFEFTSSSGYQPVSKLCLSSEGKIYGTAQYGGDYNLGVLFEFDPNSDTYSKGVNFLYGKSGFLPSGGVIQSSNGMLYGTTSFGGASNMGVIFEFNTSTKNYTKKIDFGVASDDGSQPIGDLTAGSNGKLYGMTTWGGANNFGVLFEYAPDTKQYNKKIDFDSLTNGSLPWGNLTLFNDKLYGLTSQGGNNNMGVLFEYDFLTGSISNKIDFDSNVGYDPEGDLTPAPNGNLYGFTRLGGANGQGTIFEFNPLNKTLVKKFDFDLATSGGYPDGVLTLVNGKLYGVAPYGGSNGMGTLFEYDPETNVFLKKFDFDENPNGNFFTKKLTLHSNGKLYGTTFIGGANNAGVLFEFDIQSNSLSKKFDFNLNTTGQPRSLTFNPIDNKLYGMISAGGSTNAKGGLFSFDPDSGTLLRISNFDGSNGANPIGGLLIIIGDQSITFNSLTPKIFGDQAFNLTATASSGLPIGYISSDPNIASINGSTVTINSAGSVIITASQNGNSITKAAQNVQQTLTINKASLTATANNQTKTYGSANPDFTFSYSGFVGSDDASVIDSPPTILSSASQFNDAGTYSITLSGGTDNNYNLLLNNGTLTINKATLTATADNQTKAYGSANPNLTFTYSGFVGLDDETALDTPPIISTDATQSSNVGSYPISLSGGSDNNYSISLIDGLLTITKADQLIQFSSVSDKTVGDPTFSLSAVASSSLEVSFSSQSNKVSLSGNQATIVISGRETIKAEQTGDGNFNAAPTVDQTFCINPAKPTISLDNSSNAPLLTSSASAGNQWYLNGEIIPGETNATLTVSKAGDYTVQVTVDDCKSEFSEAKSLVITGDISIKEKVTLFPNPSNDYLFIKGLSQESKICTIIDLVGSRVDLPLSSEQELQRADIRSLSAGVYVLQIDNNGELHTLKFVKQ